MWLILDVCRHFSAREVELHVLGFLGVKYVQIIFVIGFPA